MELVAEVTVSEPVIVNTPPGMPDIAQITISLSQPSRFTVTVDCQIAAIQPSGAGGAGIGTPGYQVLDSIIRTLTFEPGEPLTQTLMIPIPGPLSASPSGLVVQLSDVDQASRNDSRVRERIS